MEDVQSRPDERNIPIDQVGISNLRYPIVVLDREHGLQHTVAQLTMSVNLPHHFKGTHMSRFVEVLNAYHGELTFHTLPTVLQDLKRRLDAESARIELRFPYFVQRYAPVTHAEALMDYECTFAGGLDGGRGDFVLGVRVPVTSLCPCSKEISDYGAHNQRGYVRIEVRSGATADGEPAMIWIEELIDIAESSASAPVYALLKRPDERYVTMQAYDHPAFVEDIVRSIAVKLRADERVVWYCVQATNEESIHNHSAFARVEWSRDVL